MTYREVCRRLSDAGIEDAAWEAECLLLSLCAASRFSLRAEPERDYTDVRLEDAVRRRLLREPLQYILGEWQFYRQTYEVSPDCLIPRSDTETLVEEAIRRLPPNARFADLCTGSGCIAISVLAERPDTRAVAVDKFPNTLALAEKNACKNGVRDRFTPLCADVLVPDFTPADQPLDAILSNPPYIATDVLATLAPEVLHEPRAALDGGADGLVFYRHILKTQSKMLKENGFFLFEIGYDQKDALIELGRGYGYSNACVKRDLGGNDRVVYLAKA